MPCCGRGGGPEYGGPGGRPWGGRWPGIPTGPGGGRAWGGASGRGDASKTTLLLDVPTLSGTSTTLDVVEVEVEVAVDEVGVEVEGDVAGVVLAVELEGAAVEGVLVEGSAGLAVTTTGFLVKGLRIMTVDSCGRLVVIRTVVEAVVVDAVVGACVVVVLVVVLVEVLEVLDGVGDDAGVRVGVGRAGASAGRRPRAGGWCEFCGRGDSAGTLSSSS